MEGFDVRLRQLRLLRGLTQEELADRLHVTRQAVSNWERGQGVPDPALWPTLSENLDADLGLLVYGVRPNRPDAGKMRALQFYVCPSCGNLLTATGPAVISCCGRQLRPLAAAEPDGAHTPAAREVDGELYVTVPHPMRKDHHLLFAAVVLDDRVHLIRLYPEQEAAFRLPYVRGRGVLYLGCTVHGLFRCPFPL